MMLTRKLRLPLGASPFFGLAFLMMILPSVIIFGADWLAWNRELASAPDFAHGAKTMGVIGVLFLLISGFMFSRRTVCIDGKQLTVAHSFYTLRLDGSSYDRVDFEALSDLSSADLSYRTNGVKVGGYASGHFVDGSGRNVFCAVGLAPLTRLNFRARSASGSDVVLVLGLDSALEGELKAWASTLTVPNSNHSPV